MNDRSPKMRGNCSVVLVVLIALSAVVQAQPKIYVLDLKNASSMPAAKRYDLRHAAVCVQGIANRDAPRVFLEFFSHDDVWLTRLRESGGLCAGWPVVNVSNLEQLIDTFRHEINGVVLYDDDAQNGVHSTSLVATTVAGVENAIALRKDTSSGSLYSQLVLDPGGPQLPVLIDLDGKFTGTGTIWQTSTPSTGSAKCDAYIWAKEKYLDTGRCNPTVLSYTLDMWGLKLNLDLQCQLNNLDYAISRQGFCFELSPWGDEAPIDDPNQPLGTDLNTMKQILDACNQQTGYSEMIKYCGFPPWPYKYTDFAGSSHGAVSTEWEMVKILSAYNVYQEADAAGGEFLTNASFYGGLVPAVEQRHYLQNPPPTYDDLVARGLIDGNTGSVVPGNYILIGMGDYDQASWTLYWLAYERWGDSQRGNVACNWGVDPNAVDRVSAAMDYMYRTKSDKDYFIGWDSGCGYINPTQLHGDRSPSGYGTGFGLYQEHCKNYYQMFDYSITGWLLNGASGTLTDREYRACLPFSADGLGYQGGQYYSMIDNVPIVGKISDLADANSSIINYSSGVNFGFYRTTIWWPNMLKQLEQNWANSGHNHRFLDAYTFYYLRRYYLGGNNDYRVSYVNHTLPRVMAVGQSYPADMTVRNDGWDTWTAQDLYRLSYAWVPEDTPHFPRVTVDNDGSHWIIERSGKVKLKAGKYPISVGYFKRTGYPILEVKWQGPGIAKQFIPDNRLYCDSDPDTNGLDYRYFETDSTHAWIRMPDWDQMGSVKDGVIANFDLSPAEQLEYFGFQYKGYIDIPVDGTYTFYSNSDDGSMLYIGGAKYHPRIELPAGTTVAPGQQVTFDFTVTAPTEPGRYEMYFDMVRDGVTWFHKKHNIQRKHKVIVAAAETDVDTDGDGMPDVTEESMGRLFWHPGDAGPGPATAPEPADGATGVSVDTILSWTPGTVADTHEVYFGTTNPPSFIGNQFDATYDPGTMTVNKTYYWRIDEVNDQGTTTGSVWSFTTGYRPRDIDGDGDVDMEDFGYFQKCRAGDNIPHPLGCDAADFNDDNNVDHDDFNMLLNCFSGADSPAAPGCLHQ